MAGSSCTGWSNLRYTGRIYDFRRYFLIANFLKKKQIYSFLPVILHYLTLLFSGCCQRFGSSHSQYIQRAFSVPHILADICHYGSANVCRKILQGDYILQLLQPPLVSGRSLGTQD